MERFDDQARRALGHARQAARDLGHDQVGTEHLLLGLLSEGGTDAARALSRCGVTFEACRAKVAEAVANKRHGPHSEDLSFTDRATLALERADRMSLRQRCDQVGTRHVLLSVLDVEGTAGQVLRGTSVDPERIRKEIERAATEEAGVISEAGVDSKTGAVSRTGVGQQAGVGQEAGAAARVPASATQPAPPRCPACRRDLEASLSYRVLAATGPGRSRARISVVYCSACGTTIGVVPG